jgi:hypothetical protein
MVNSFAMMHVGLRRHAIPPNSSRAASFPDNAHLSAAIFGILCRRWNPLKPQASPILEPLHRIKSASRFDIHSPLHSPSGELSMTLTVAHISPVMSVIAGLLILIVPRLLNLVVAIFLILNGLIGLGLLKWLHL